MHICTPRLAVCSLRERVLCATAGSKTDMHAMTAIPEATSFDFALSGARLCSASCCPHSSFDRRECPFQKPRRLTLGFPVRGSALLMFAHAVVYTALLLGRPERRVHREMNRTSGHAQHSSHPC